MKIGRKQCLTLHNGWPGEYLYGDLDLSSQVSFICTFHSALQTFASYGMHLISPMSTAKPAVSFLSNRHLSGPLSPSTVRFPILTPESYPNVPFISKIFVAPSNQNSISDVVCCTRLSPSSKYSSPFALPTLSGATKSSKSNFRSAVVVLVLLVRRGMIEPPRRCTGISVNEILARVMFEPLLYIGFRVWKS